VILGGGVAADRLFTFVVASRGHVCDCIAFLLYTFIGRDPSSPGLRLKFKVTGRGQGLGLGVKVRIRVEY